MYTIRTVTLQNGKQTKKVPVIDFEDPEKAIIAEFLMSDGELLAEDINDAMEEVKAGKRDSAEWTGNRCSVTLHHSKAVIEDLLEGVFEETATYRPCEIKVNRLQELIKMWQEVKRRYR